MKSPRETSGVTTRLVIEYVRSRGGDAAVSRVLDKSGTTHTLEHLEDESAWVSFDEKVALFHAAADVLDEPMVTIAMGETVLDERVGAFLKVALRALGSPGKVFKETTKTAAKFSSCCTMQAIDVTKAHATVTYRLHEGYQPDVLDCGLNIGLLSQVPRLFGLPAARVEHDICQAKGAERCVYSVSWRPRRLFGSRRRNRVAMLEDQLLTITERAGALASTVADLVSPDDLETVLQRISARAAGAVGARGHILAVQTVDDSDARILSDGIGVHRADRLGHRLLEGERTADDEKLLIAEVSSSRRAYGWLVAVPAENQSFFPEDASLLAAYARHAAIALDVALALEEARNREERGEAQRRALAQSEQRYRSLFANHPDAVFTFDLTGHFVELNPACATITGYAVEELVGTHFLPLLLSDSVEEAGRIFSDALDGVGQEFTLGVRHKSGEPVLLRGTSFPVIVDGEITGVYGIARRFVADRIEEPAPAHASASA